MAVRSVFLVRQFRRIIKEKITEEYSYKFLVFTPHGKIDEKSTNKLNQMIEKLNNDVKSNQLIYLYFQEMIIDNKNDIIDLFSITAGEMKNLRIFHDGKYSLREISFKTDRFPSIDSKGNLIVCNYNEKTKEIMIKIFRRDGEYKDIDEVKIKIEKNMIHYSDIETDAKPFPKAFTVDPRGHIFIVFPIKKSLYKTEWQIEKYDYGIEKADLVMKYPGYVVYEFDFTGQLIGPRALLQTIYNRLLDKDAYGNLKNRLKLDDQGNLYYLHYQSDSTQIWMVPSSRNAKRLFRKVDMVSSRYESPTKLSVRSYAQGVSNHRTRPQTRPLWTQTHPSAHTTVQPLRPCTEPCSMCPKAASTGAACPTTSPRGKPSPITSVTNKRWACWNRCNTRWSHGRVGGSDAGSPKRWRWTVRACRPPKKEGSRIQWGQENQSAQTAHRGRLSRELVRGSGDGCRCVGCAWGVWGVGRGFGALWFGADSA